MAPLTFGVVLGAGMAVDAGTPPAQRQAPACEPQVEVERLDETVVEFTIRAMDGGAGIVLAWQNSRVHVPINAG
ncbi:MAG: hypothetical protein R6U63_12765 [Longimicrobiales bacterium]